jgi:murein DD-endopeptidase MepM/ murein hydrolase activator NlpD
MKRTRDRPREWELGAAVILSGLHLSLCLALQARPGIAGVVLWYIGPSLLALLGALVLLGTLVSAMRQARTRSALAAQHSPVSPGRAARLVVLAALAGAPAFYRTYPSSHDGHPSNVRFVLPLDGATTVAWGGDGPDSNAHRIATDQRWGYDLLVTVGGMSFQGSGRGLSDYHAYGRQLRAPAAGVVLTVHGREPDTPIGRKGKGDDLGNHIVFQVGGGEFLFMAHLQPESILVRPGDRVVAGQPLGRVGNSGFSSEPHVHLHLQDSPRRHLAEGIPFGFADYCAADAYVLRGMPRGGREDDRWVGQIVRRAEAQDCQDSSEAHDKFTWGSAPHPGSVARVPRHRSGRPELLSKGGGPCAPLRFLAGALCAPTAIRRSQREKNLVTGRIAVHREEAS